ncbi:hypothetical protein PFICI_14253 [Pestalotiopsis fici W106-1]|uniref:P-loop containing nucleoside triphosphate hydrolase protein n=1 Tax=Pestalotiopsis fici (strain W106-1 / CGMCC3.15140) TaxID=1229662 RepID=W3WML0_PESFW|nr:uncharacterized protein PFICI_14253 [Pestalotiopsis fici W106-1]ETS74387.1 hypothetical protein PFICI_14253 [Pestalotiopsis fici W106-1]
MAVQCDDTFGPVVASSCRGGFDFTLLFEQTVLGILPAAIFALSAASRLLYLVLHSTDAKTHAGSLRLLKLVGSLPWSSLQVSCPALKICHFKVTATILAALQVALLILWCKAPPLNRTAASLPSAALNLFAAVELLALTWVEDVKSVRPSSLLNIYLVSTVFFDAVQVRTLYLQSPANTALAAVFTFTITVKLVLLFLEGQSKTTSLTPPYQGLPPESTSSIINRSFLWWVNDLFYSGLRSILTLDDLYVLDGKLASAPLHAAIAQAWQRRTKPERRFEFPWAACRALWRPLLLVVFPRLCMIGFTFAQPFLISTALGLLSQPSDQQSTNNGYGIIGATALVYLGLAVSTLNYNQNLYRFVTMFRGATVNLIYQHALSISSNAYDESGALTLMSTDIDRIILCLIDVNECWARTIEVIVGMTLLALQLGWISIVPLVVVVVSFFGATRISSTIGARQKVWIDAVQKRVSITASVLASMKAVKMMGLSRILTTLIQDQRVEETHRMANFRWSIVAQNMVQNLPWFVAPALTFVIYAAQAHGQGEPSINTTQAFTALSIITLLTAPSAKLLSAVVSTAASVGCFDRIQDFLLAAPRHDQRRATTWSNTPISIPKTENFQDGDIEMTTLMQDSRNSGSDPTVAIAATCLSVRPTSSAEVVLTNAHFIIPRKSVTMIIGPVASGKTTLLRTVLGELKPEDGSSISVASRRIAYASQTPWLPNTSIRNAIVGPEEMQAKFDHSWYSKTLFACALDCDIGLLKDGDETCIGDAGAVLSGGQKQRVSLARAVYSRAPIMLLDDVIAALDVNTQVTVMSRLFGESGLLRSFDSTVLFVTHSARFLSYADKVLIVCDGRIEDGGSYGNTVSKEVARVLPLADDSDIQPQSESKTPTANEAAALVAKANQHDDLSRASGDLKLYSYYFRSIGLLSTCTLVGFVIMNVFCNSFVEIWLNWWTDDDGGHIALYMSIYLALAVMAVVGMGGYETHKCARAPQSFFSATDTGSILNRFSQDMTIIEGQLPTGVLITVSNLFECISCAALVATGSSYMAISVPLLAVAVWALQHVYLRTSRQLRLLDLEARSPLFTHFMESLTGLVTIRAFGWEQAFMEQNYRKLDYSQRPYYLLYCIQIWLNLVLDLIVGAEAVLVVGLAIWLRSSTSVGLLGVSLNNVLCNSSLSSLVSGWTMLETSLGSIARLRDFEATVKAEDDVEQTRGLPINWPELGRIQLRNVTALYHPGVLGIQDVSLEIEPGQKIGICGRTGSGKSSFISTLVRLLDINSGAVLIDNVNLTTISGDTIRERLFVIPQESLTFPSTLRRNLDPHNTATDAALTTALLRVGLHDLLAASRGLDTDITASALSAGQQQLLALARLLVKKDMEMKVKDRGVLLLDEATSHVDQAAEEVLQRVVREEFANFTVIAVAHRLDTILESDVIVVMDAGRVVEVGQPRELIEKGQWFARLVKAYTGATISSHE